MRKVRRQGEEAGAQDAGQERMGAGPGARGREKRGWPLTLQQRERRKEEVSAGEGNCRPRQLSSSPSLLPITQSSKSPGST